MKYNKYFGDSVVAYNTFIETFYTSHYNPSEGEKINIFSHVCCTQFLPKI